MPPAVLRAAVRRTGLRRDHLTAGRICVERHILARHPGRPFDRSPRILCYHSAGTPEWGVNDVSPVRFAHQVEAIMKSGRRFVPASTIAAGDGKDGDIALTFDDGLRSVAIGAAPVLRDLGIPWTLFVVSDWCEGRGYFARHIMNWREVEQAATSGATIANHSATHPNFGLISPAQAEDEIVRSRDTLLSRIGVTTDEFAIPLGLPSDWTSHAHAVALASGHRYIYAQAEARRSPGTIARTMITRFDDGRLFNAAITGAYENWLETR